MSHFIRHELLNHFDNLLGNHCDNFDWLKIHRKFLIPKFILLNTHGWPISLTQLETYVNLYKNYVNLRLSIFRFSFIGKTQSSSKI